MSYVQILVRGVPADLKQKIVEDAERRGLTMTEVVVGILADEFRVKYEPTGRPTLTTGDSPDLVLRAPKALRTKINVRAAQVDGTARGVVIETLSRHYGDASADPGRRRRKGRAAA